ncbi:amino acid ABC transporter substrate-binding protein [Variovorax sp. AB1(2024)]|jgi:glutamate/aspartate transport system substrate-binding protein|uniref:amino acid ABC transporter substrate-binding protein n=2 Tax=Variovorax TaxID=34072 RepID=UPI000D134708|nr:MULTISPECIES: amino acid ABC transporter substrate-binding protein [unclassified Variovorax]AVQ81760.1 amino acid ABC transporter substrate-binding protein [Variovorax sp. PMC12]QRY33983.1 amino acid ABC transporter substrate-binding protein [Variovorax sp. PDNC026]
MPTSNTKSVALAAMLVACASASAQSDTLGKIKESSSITMGVRDASGAMSFTLGPGKYTGFHVEICERVIADIRKALHLDKIDVKYQLVTPQNRIPLVQNGTVDIECGTTTNNAARQKDVAFAPTLYVEGIRIAVKTNSGIASPAQLAGKTVAATTGSTSVQALRRLGRDGVAGVSEVLSKDNSEGFLLLEGGRAEGFIADGQILATLISRSKEPEKYRLLDQVFSVEPIAIMFRKGDPAFKKMVDDSILALARSGEVSRIYDKWFMQPIPPNGARVGLPANAMTKAAWAAPSDKPLEAYEAR